MSEITYKTDIYRFNVSQNKWALKKEYDLLLNFKFSGKEYYLTRNGGWYFVCVSSNNGDLYSVKYYKEAENGERILPGEILSEFRKEYLKRKLTKEDVDKFIADPMPFFKKR